MKFNRRSFLKILGGAAAAAVVAPIIAPQTTLALPSTAPLFIPSKNLDMGVPRRILTATEMPTASDPWLIPESVQREIIDAQMRKTIPMLLLQDNYISDYGGRLKAGHEVLVDRVTAARWVDHGVAAPGPNAPRDIQELSAKRIAEQRQGHTLREYRDALAESTESWNGGIGIAYVSVPVIYPRSVTRLSEAERDQRWVSILARAAAKARSNPTPTPDWWGG